MTMIELGPEANKSLKFLAHVQQNEIEIVQTGHNSYGGYKYAKLGDILKAIQPHLKEYNCLVVFSEDEHRHDLVEVSIDEDEDRLYYIHTNSIVTCRVLFADNPNDYIQTQSHGYGVNKNADKTCKATTGAKKYSLVNLLCMKQINDEDIDSDELDVQQYNKNTFKKSPQSMRRSSTKRERGNKLV